MFYAFIVAVVSALLLLLNETNAGIPEGVGSIKLAGLLTGTTIKFEYFGKYYDFGTVVFSLKDKYGAGLRIQLNHRKKRCEFTWPNIISFNSLTNGKLGPSEDEEVDVIETTYWNGNWPYATADEIYGWEITAEEDGFKIIEKDYFDQTETPLVSHFFKYRSPHQLSDITQVMIEETQVCERGRWHAYVFFEQKIIPDFKKLTFQGTDPAQDAHCNPHRESFASVDFYGTRIILYAYNKEYRMSAKMRTQSVPNDLEICQAEIVITSKTKFGVHIAHKTGTTYAITLSANDVPLEKCTFDMPLTELEKNNGILKTYYNHITQLEME